MDYKQISLRRTSIKNLAQACVDDYIADHGPNSDEYGFEAWRLDCIRSIEDDIIDALTDAEIPEYSVDEQREFTADDKGDADYHFQKENY